MQQNLNVIKRILFVHNSMTPFVRIDLDILAETFEVEEMYLDRIINMNPFTIWKAIRRNQVVFAWFASWHSLLPVYFASLQNKVSIVVTGGYDVAGVAEANYGHNLKWRKRIISKFILRKATHLVCNSFFSKEETIHFGKIASQKVSLVYHGIPDRRISLEEKTNIALNVGNVCRENLKRKGITPFLAAGALSKSYQFIQVGKWQDNSYKQLSQYISENVQLKGFLKEKDLNSLLAKSKVYIQPSLHEGFGLSVVEAMQAGCIPIVSRHGALPEVVGRFGILLDDVTPEAIERGINQVKHYKFLPGEISEFALSNYSLEVRAKGLLHCINAQFSNDYHEVE